MLTPTSLFLVGLLPSRNAPKVVSVDYQAFYQSGSWRRNRVH
jgi:hypothetical protein